MSFKLYEMFCSDVRSSQAKSCVELLLSTGTCNILPLADVVCRPYTILVMC